MKILIVKAHISGNLSKLISEQSIKIPHQIIKLSAISEVTHIVNV